jgi:alkyl hydroperoxide reductase subunit AhpC
MKIIILVLNFLVLTFYINAQNLSINESFAIEKLDFYKNSPCNKIVVFMPSLYDGDCEYASMLTHSLNRYYMQGLTFENEQIKPKFDVILIVNHYDKWASDNYSHKSINRTYTDGLILRYDAEGKYFKQLGVQEFEMKNIDLGRLRSKDTHLISILPPRSKSSTLFVLDTNDIIVFKDKDYRSQGEHLKPLDNFIKQKFCGAKIPVKTDYPKLKIGDKIPNFLMQGPISNRYGALTSLESDTQNVKILTFYPAAFSGVLTPKDDETSASIKSISCSYQILELNSLDFPGVKNYAISNSTNGLLQTWTALLETYKIIYLNDIDNSIAGKFNTLHPDGYNKRYTYIIDKDNRIRYIDEDFTEDDSASFKAELKKLNSKK